MGLDAGLAGALSYLFTWITGLIFFLVEQNNTYVKFNGFQAMLLGAVLTIFWIIAVILDSVIVAAAVANNGGFAFSVLTFIVWILSLILVVLMMYRGYVGAQRNEITMLPLIGKIAFNQTYGKTGDAAPSNAPAPAEAPSA